MDFRKYLKITTFLISLCVVSNYVYDKYIKVGFNTVEINIDNLCQGAKATYFTFEFSDRNVTVKDTKQSIKKIYTNKSNLNNNIYLQCKKSGKYFILMDGAVLKTTNDSIDIEDNYEKVHGYMGTLIKKDCYFIDENLKFTPCASSTRN